ncbi:MAG TPA: acyl-CoA thioesterase [Leptospiraceae bacterium]|nr:acyl-CoA thioesterase [Leptospiraceae bacterium]
MDSSMHINNANFLRYTEEARVHMMVAQQFPMEEVHKANVEMILYKSVSLYKEQVRYPESLTVKSKQIQTKKVRGILRQEIYKEDGSLCFVSDAYWAYHAKDKSAVDATIQFTKKFGADSDNTILPLEYDNNFKASHNYPHVNVKIEVRPYELDSFQHVNNAVYANYFEIGRWEFRRTVLPDLNYFKDMGLTFVIYKNTIEFIRPAFLFQELNIRTWLIEITPARIIYWQEIEGENGTIHANCRSEGCVIDKAGNPVKLKPEIIRAYNALLVH